MAIKIQLRRGTAAEWTTENPILADGEQGHETDTSKRKIGDGVTAWNSLPYIFAGGGGGGVTDHGLLDGPSLLDDDHPQYLNNTRGDDRYYTKSQIDSQQNSQDTEITNSRNRANHIGTQLASTISNFATTVRNTVLSGFISLNSVVTASDTVLIAIGKLQGQINSILAVLFYAEFARNTTGLINNTTTEEDFLVLNADIPVAGNYEVHWSYEWSGNDGAQDIIVRLYSGVVARWTNQQEPKDTAGTGVTLPNTTGGNSNSGTNQRHLGHAHEIFQLPAGQHQLKITLDSSNAGDLNAIYKGVISIKKFGVS